MADLSKLSHDELVRFVSELQNKDTIQPLKCKYESTRTKTKCTSLAVDTIGYCKEHSTTLQALKAKRLEDTKNKDDVVLSEDTDKETTSSSDEDTLELSHNDYGNFEHKKTHIVFNLESRKAYGVQKTGYVVPLRQKDIEECIKHKWRYQVIQTPIRTVKKFGKKE